MLTAKELIKRKAEIENKFNKQTMIAISGLGECKFRTVTKDDMEDSFAYKDGSEADEYIVANTMVEPDLTDPELLSAYGVSNNVDLLKKLLLFGEIKSVAEVLLKESKYTDECAQVVENLKNS